MAKGASKTGGTAGRKRVADSAMASRIRDEKRTYQLCPICHRLAPVGDGWSQGIVTHCKGNR